MAKLKGGLPFKGSLDNISVYTRWDMDTPIVRIKGGPSKQKIKKDPAFALTRRYQGEFGSRSKQGGNINKVLYPIKPVLGINVVSAFGTMVQPAQEHDKVSHLGQRSILLSQVPELLNGVNLNKRNPFETILSTPLSCTGSREDLKVSVKLPAINPGFNFHPIGTFPVYRLIVVAGIVPDYHYDPLKGYCHYYDLGVSLPEVDYGEWTSVREAAASRTVELTLPHNLEREDHCLLVAAGISFGLVRAASNFEAVRGAGCGKVIGVF
jgi:hypothetical protein